MRTLTYLGPSDGLAWCQGDQMECSVLVVHYLLPGIPAQLLFVNSSLVFKAQMLTLVKQIVLPFTVSALTEETLESAKHLPQCLLLRGRRASLNMEVRVLSGN